MNPVTGTALFIYDNGSNEPDRLQPGFKFETTDNKEDILVLDRDIESVHVHETVHVFMIKDFFSAIGYFFKQFSSNWTKVELIQARSQDSNSKDIYLARVIKMKLEL